MKRFDNWAVFLATPMAVASVGISAVANPAPDAAPAAPVPAAVMGGADTPSASESPGAPATGQAAQSGYLGSDACVVCHENYDKTVEVTKHGFKANERTPMAKQGCESCHGPGADYSPEAVMLDKTSARAKGLLEVNAATCAPCHEKAHGKPFIYILPSGRWMPGPVSSQFFR